MKNKNIHSIKSLRLDFWGYNTTNNINAGERNTEKALFFLEIDVIKVTLKKKPPPPKKKAATVIKTEFSPSI